MFQEHFRLREQPFGVTPDPRYLFPSPGHREALASLIYGIESDLGFGALVAEPGMGKTTLLFHILERYRQSARTAFIFNTQCNSYDLLQSLLSELDDKPVPRETFLLHERFKQILTIAAAAHQRVILVIDEAHNLGDAVMETVRLLSNFESASFKLLHIILAAQPELAGRLSRPELSQLQQRIPILNKLPCLSPLETASYIEHRLRVAGYQGRALFAPESLMRIAEISRGVPREINRLCFNCLSLAYASGKTVIDLETMEEVAADLGLGSRLPKKQEIPPQERVRASAPSHRVVQAAAPTGPPENFRPTHVHGREFPNPATSRAASAAVTARPLNQRSGVAPLQQPLPRTQRPAAPKRKSRSLLYRSPSAWRPIGFGLVFLTLVVVGWTSAPQWMYLISAAGRPSVSTTATSDSPKDLDPSLGSAIGQPSISIENQPGLIRLVRPQYPKAARDHQIEGTVISNAMVARNGRVKDVKHLKGDPTLLKAADSAVRGWIYEPYQVNGKAVNIYRQVVIRFSLHTDHSEAEAAGNTAEPQ